jgi:hypothetical protein
LAYVFFVAFVDEVGYPVLSVQHESGVDDAERDTDEVLINAGKPGVL